MTLLRKYLTLYILILSSVSYATSLSGTVSQTTQLKLYFISNFLTGEKTTVAQCDVSKDKRYHFAFESHKLRTYYIDLGVRRVQVVIAPKQNLTLDLPDYIPLRKADYLNPYFEKDNILLYDEKIHDINYHQMNIELCSSQQLKQVLESQTPSYSASVAIDTLKQLLSNFNSRYLEDYVHYSQAPFYQMAHPENIQAIKQKYLRKAEPDLQNSAFTKLFSSEYHNPFLASDGLFYQDVSDVIISESLPDNFSMVVSRLLKIENKNMAELITVKGFYDAAKFAPTYQRSLTQLMLQLEEQLENTDIKELCRTSRLKIERLMIGNPAPYYELFTLKGKKVPTVLKRRYVLLAFVNTNIFECQRQLRLLEKYKAQYKRQIEVVVVAVYQDEKELERFLKRNSYENIYFTLWQNNEQLLDDYNVKAMPSYYLIGNDGNIIYAPLSSPEEMMGEQLQSEFGY